MTSKKRIIRMSNTTVRIVLTACIFLIALSAHAQKEITGTVVEKSTGEAVVGANVMLKNADGKIVKFTVTGTDGGFHIKMPTQSEGMSIQASMLGMKTCVKTISEKTDNITLQMEEEIKKLKEIVVKSERIRENGDTLTYRVSGFAQKQDRTIGDVLRRMPGIDVAANGKIQYQGTDINRFYIEGSDMLGGKYGIATNGISHDDIGAVEVMENHQPMQVLQGLSFSDKAAINLKLKDKAKATWLLSGHIGGGSGSSPEKALWDGDLMLMAVMSDYQTITTMKANNTGTDLRQQLTDFFAERRNTETGDYLSVQLPSAPNLKAEHTTFNRSQMISSSHLWKVKTNEIKAQVDYYNHRATATTSSVYTYLLNNAEKVIAEERNGTEHGNRLTGDFSFEANKKNYYLKNTFKTELDWDDTDTKMDGTLSNSQSAKTPDYYISNRLKLIKRMGGKHLFTLTSVNEWESKPQNLSVSYQDKKNLSQRISGMAFYTDEKIAYGFHLKGLTMSLEGGINGFLRNMSSELYMDKEYTDGNNITTNYLSLYVTPKLEYAFKKIGITLEYPFNCTWYKFSRSIANRTEYFHSPSLNIRWKPVTELSLSVTGNIGRSPINLRDIHDGAILSDYRTVTLGVEDFYINTDKRVSARIQYRNIMKGFFANVFAAKSWNSTPYKTVQYFVDDFILNSYESSTSHTQSLNIIGNASKMLNFMQGSIGINGRYTRLSGNILSENIPTTYHNSSWNIGGRINGKFANLIFLSYKFNFNRSQLAVNDKNNRVTDRYTHGINITVSPTDALFWETEGEYYRNEESEDHYNNIFLLDTKLTWKISKHIEITASVCNIMNRKKYTYTTYNSLYSMESVKYLRGRECMLTIYLK